MAIIGVASVRVRPDLTGFRQELTNGLRKIKVEFKVRVSADTDRAERQIRQLADRMNGLDIKVDPEINTRKIKQAENDIEKLKSHLRDVGRISVDVGRGFLAATGRTAMFALAAGSLASTLTGTSSVIGGLGSAIAGLGGAAVGVGIGALVTFAAVSATVKLATSGMGDAFKAVAEGDAAALAKAMEKLSPAGQDFVKQVSKLKPIFDDMKLAVQTALFKDLGVEVAQTGKALSGSFKGLFTSIGQSLNKAGIDVLRFLRTAESMKTIDQINKDIATGFKNASGAAKPLTSAILNLVSSATSLLPELGSGLADVINKFAKFIQSAKDSGALTEFFRNAIETVKQFGRIIRDFGVGISNVFKIGSDTGGGFLNILERTASSFRRFTESTSGKAALTSLFETIRTLAEAFGRLLSTLRPVLEPLGRLAKIVAEELAGAMDRIGPKLRDTLIKLFEKLAEAAPSLISAFEKIVVSTLELVDVLAPLLPGLAKLVDRFADISGPAGIAAVALIALLGTKMGLVVAAGIGLGLLLIEVGKGIKSFVNQAGDDIENFGKDLQRVGGPFEILGKGVEIFGSGIGRDPREVRELFRKQGVEIGSTLLEGITSGVAKAQAEALVPGVNSAVSQILSLFDARKNEFTRAGGLSWAEVGQGITNEQAAVTARLQAAADALLGLLNGKNSDFAVQGANISRALASGMTAEQQRIVTAMSNALTNLLNAMSGKQPAYEAEGRAISARLGSGIASGQSTPVSAAQSVGNAIVGIFGGVSLHSQGVSMMSSLRNGIQSASNTIKQVLGAITNLIPSWKGPESVDKKLLFKPGVWIMEGLVDGITSQIPLLERELGNVTSSVETAFSPDGFTIDRSGQLALTGGVEPTSVIVDIDLNEGTMNGLIDAKVTNNNRTIKRFGQTGVTA